jgi:hypothetical protein
MMMTMMTTMMIGGLLGVLGSLFTPWEGAYSKVRFAFSEGANSKVLTP